MLRPCSPRTSDSRPLVGWHLSPEPEHQGRSSRDLRLPNKYQTEATAQRLRCLVTIGSALGFRLRTWPACCPRECSPPCPPHTRGRGATSSKQDQKGRMTQGVAWEVESCTPSGSPSQGGTSETELTAILRRTARCKGCTHSEHAPRGDKQDVPHTRVGKERQARLHRRRAP